MTKLWLSPAMEFRHSPPGWPEEPSKPGPMMHQEFFKEYYDDELPKYHKALAKAKELSILVDIPAGMLIGLRHERNPDSFIDVDFELKIVRQVKRKSGWEDVYDGMTLSVSEETRLVARLMS